MDQTARADKGVLLLWTSGDRGIRSAGRTLAGLLRAKPHGLDVVDVDLLEALAGRKLVSRVAGFLDPRLEEAALASLGWPAVAQALAGLKPRVVVAMDPPAAAALDAWRGKGLLRAPLVGVLSGLLLEPAWTRTAVDRLSVADETQAAEGLALGLPPECVVPCGVPVCGGFSGPSFEERALYRKRFDVPTDRPICLVVTDGLSPDQMTSVLFQLGLVSERVNLLFDIALDEQAAELLRRRAALYGVTARMFGKVEAAGELWASADLVAARPFRYVEQRALALRLPLLALLPQGSVEQQTAEVYQRRGIGRQVTNPALLATELDLMLSPAAMEQASRALAGIGKRRAAQDLARLIAQVGAEAEAILDESLKRSRPPSEAEASPEVAAAPRKGPLETIGPPSTPTVGDNTPRPSPKPSPEELDSAEAEAGRQVLEHQTETERWDHRALLARGRGDPELAATARRMADRHRESMHRALAELARLAELRARPEDPEARLRKLEDTFRKLETEDALAALKRKMGL